MAFQMIHMEIAYRVWKRISFSSPEEFIVGSVAPDSVHMDPSYYIGMKIHSHLFEGCGPWGDTQDYDRWMDQILSFWRERGSRESDPSKRAFFFGIAVHCLTDYYNDRNIWRHFQSQHLDMDIEAFRSIFNVEARGIDQWLYHSSEHTLEICGFLAEGHGYELDGMLKLSDIERTKQHLLYEQYIGEVPPVDTYRMVTKEFLLQFLDETVEKILPVIL